MKKSLKTMLVIICVLLVCVFAFSAYKVISTIAGYRQAASTYDSIAQQFLSIDTSPKPIEEFVDDIDPEISPIGNIDFEGLRNITTDYVAWIYSPDTAINYPIVYTDNNFYYLDHIPVAQQNANGTLFIDCKCASDFSDQNTLIYGHNMNDGSMFAGLRDYRNVDFYPEHPVMYLSTPDFNYRLDLIAGFVTEPTSFAYQNNFDEPEQFMAYIEHIRELSNFKSDVEVSEDDRVVTLSTCTYEINDGRYVVVGKLTRIH